MPDLSTKRIQPQTLEVTVTGTVTVDLADSGVAAILGGVGLMYVPEPLVREHVRGGALRIVLPDWAPIGPGFHIYYSSRRQLPTGLRLLIELVRELRPLGL